MTHSRSYALLGATLGIGAPIGLLSLRFVLEGSRPFLEWVFGEVAGDPWLYVYVTGGTILAMALFGRALGVKEDRLAQLSLTDALTGLLNRRHFDQRLAEEVARAHRYLTPLTLMVIDLDRFKLVNDRFGHPAGDSVLRTVAQMVRESFRGTDIVCRYGGEEIAVIAPSTELPEALRLAERARERISQTVVPITGEPYRVTISVGLASLGSGPDGTLEDLVARADAAMYDAKRRGRNQCRAAVASGDAAPTKSEQQ